VFLVGGPANDARAEKFVFASGSIQIVNACDLRLIEATAPLRLADLFVGPSSGPLNLAAAGGTDGSRLICRGGKRPPPAQSRG
jgi:heptosyltransferase II